MLDDTMIVKSAFLHNTFDPGQMAFTGSVTERWLQESSKRRGCTVSFTEYLLIRYLQKLARDYQNLFSVPSSATPTMYVSFSSRPTGMQWMENRSPEPV
jgi:hypothetical protein